MRVLRIEELYVEVTYTVLFFIDKFQVPLPDLTLFTVNLFSEKITKTRAHVECPVKYNANETRLEVCFVPISFTCLSPVLNIFTV